MKAPVSNIAFTPAVKIQQERFGSRAVYAKMEKGVGWKDTISPELKVFISERDSLYLATTSATGYPYIQHRGGKKGFLKVLDAQRMAFADFSGNRQYITVGNLSENDRAFIFLMDYKNQLRIKIWGRAEIVENDANLMATVSDSDHRAERAIVFTLEALDINCPKHIPRLYSSDEVRELLEKIDTLETEVVWLRKGAAIQTSNHNE